MLVSIIIPCYNVENYIEECLDSVYRQSYKPLEVIAVDNNSQDQTLEKLKAYQQKQPDLIVIQELKQGAPAARNKGLYHSTGEWIQFLDADDILLPEKIENQIEKLLKSKIHPGLVVGNYKRVNMEGEEICIYAEGEDMWQGLLKTRLGITSANLWEKELLLRIGGWNESLKSSQETDLMFRLLKSEASIIFDSAVNTVIRSREGSISSTNIENNWSTYIDLREQIVEYLISNNEYTQERKAAAHEILFLAIRNLYLYNPAKAIQLHKKLIPNNYYPRRYSRAYAFLYRLLGLSKTEKLHQLLKN